MSDAAIRGVILAGGFGTRVRHLLPEVPKPMAPAAGRPFVEWVARFLAREGITELTVSTGYRAEKIENHFRHAAVPGTTLRCIPEREPLGTAGGFLNAAAGQRAECWLVANGDSLALAGLAPLRAALEGMDAALLGLWMENCDRYGTLAVDERGRLREFQEKRPGRGVINAGVYLLREELLGRFPAQRPLSFELDVFPALLAGGVRTAVAAVEAPFLDIGTEQTLAQADAFVRAHPEYFL
jgi:NDP-sugar pyrophosphorylase family protein